MPESLADLMDLYIQGGGTLNVFSRTGTSVYEFRFSVGGKNYGQNVYFNDSTVDKESVLKLTLQNAILFQQGKNNAQVD